MNTKKKICFIANFSKTYFFHAIAEELIQQGCSICWITSNMELYRFLISHYGKESVLLINRDTPSADAIDDFKLNELIFGDRVLKYEAAKGLRFLHNIQAPIYDFLKTHRIRFVFGETTWAQEILIYRMCRKRKELNCKYLNPHVVRIPNNRFAFFEDEEQAKILELNMNKKNNYAPLEVKKPSYLKINDQRLKKANSAMGRLERIKRWFTNENIDKKDPTILNSGLTRFTTRTLEESNKEIYKLVKRVSFEELSSRPYIFVGLHKQPEASVDVFGRYYEDQAQNIINLWRALPQGWNIIVKEHTNAIGDRNLSFYKRLLAMPNIHFVEERTDSYKLIRQAEAVATITGTIALEAALMRKVALTFAPVFFNRLNYCRQIKIEDLKYCNNLESIIKEVAAQEDNRASFSNYLMQNSFEGTFSDPISNEAILEKKNVQIVSEGFLKVMIQLEQKLLTEV